MIRLNSRALFKFFLTFFILGDIETQTLTKTRVCMDEDLTAVV